MDLRGEEARKLLGEASFKLLGTWLDSIDREAIINVAEGATTYAVKDDAGTVIVEFEASAKTAATVTWLLEHAVKTQKEKLAAWMIAHSFTTGHGDTQEDLLRELAWQVELLRDASVGL
jgi:hypothetical protein